MCGRSVTSTTSLAENTGAAFDVAQVLLPVAADGCLWLRLAAGVAAGHEAAAGVAAGVEAGGAATG